MPRNRWVPAWVKSTLSTKLYNFCVTQMSVILPILMQEAQATVSQAAYQNRGIPHVTQMGDGTPAGPRVNQFCRFAT